MLWTACTRTKVVAIVVAGLLGATTPALAAGSNMPWEQPLQQILQSIEGPVTNIIAVIIIIVTGLSLAFGDAGGGFPPHPDRVRPVDRLRRIVLLSVLLLVRRRSADLMTQIVSQEPIQGFEAPVHRALTEPILLAGGAACGRDPQRHGVGRYRAGAPPLDCRARAVGAWPHGCCVGREARPSVRRSSATARAPSGPFRFVR